MDWHEASKPATFGEKIAMIIFVPLGLIAFMVVFGAFIEMAAERAEQRDRCLRQATNGYDIERCR